MLLKRARVRRPTTVSLLKDMLCNLNLTILALPTGASPDFRTASHPTPLPPSTPTKAAKVLGIAPLADSALVGVDSDDDEDESPKRPSLWRSGKHAAKRMFANLSCLPSPFSPPPARQYLMPVLDTRDPDQLQANFVNSIGYVQHESAGRPRGSGGPSVSPSGPRRRRGRNGRRGGRSAVDRMAAIREAEGEDGVEGEEEDEDEDEEEGEEEEEADLPSLRSSIDLDEEPTLHVAIAVPVRWVQPSMVNFG
jgi:hypothetical protein